MFGKILIANRGEIACRIITTARRLGISTVAVYSDADGDSPHVAMADETVCIGPAPPRESYLNGAKLVAAARDLQAQAIHPGYGFLAENPEFAEQVEAASLCFIGPPAEAIREMGLKDRAKIRMQHAGIPVIPGYHGAGQDDQSLIGEASAIGYPLLVKARAGGGGKGMRYVDGPDQLRDALAEARREASTAFGDSHLLLEKFICQPRHIEVQIFADTHGNIVHLFERDCSLQRRYQKIVEEAPAPGMEQHVRRAICEAAVEAARTIGYRGAGTVEFIADASDGLAADRFWFMEMNTRLQVEHPVSEAITGIDFVELQLRIASGEAIPFKQSELNIRGHAVEARIYAENVSAGFLPATGRVDHLRWPAATRFRPGQLRVDSGIGAGSIVSPYYDPMLAKIISHAPSREKALAVLHAGLQQCHLAGVRTNLSFLAELLQLDAVKRGHVDTGLVTRESAYLTAARETKPHIKALAAIAMFDASETQAARDLPVAPDASVMAAGRASVRPSAIFSEIGAWQLWTSPARYLALHDELEQIDYEVIFNGGDCYEVRFGGVTVELTARSARDHYVVDYAGSGARIGFAQLGPDVWLFSEGYSYHFIRDDRLVLAEDKASTDQHIRAPMPGLVRHVASKASKVRGGERVATLEAMKMEHQLTAPFNGLVADVFVHVGDQVEEGALMLALLADTDPEEGPNT